MKVPNKKPLKYREAIACFCSSRSAEQKVCVRLRLKYKVSLSLTPSVKGKMDNL